MSFACSQLPMHRIDSLRTSEEFMKWPLLPFAVLQIFFINRRHGVLGILLRKESLGVPHWILLVCCNSIAAAGKDTSLIRISYHVNYLKPTIMRKFINNGIEGTNTGRLHLWRSTYAHRYLFLPVHKWSNSRLFDMVCLCLLVSKSAINWLYLFWIVENRLALDVNEKRVLLLNCLFSSNFM